MAIEHGVEKIKTVGDNYMLAGGLPEPRTDHAHAVAEMGLAMLAVIERTNRDRPTPLQMRIGIHTGDVVAGVIGTHKFVYDVWGDTVNIASRMESHGMVGRIHVSADTQRHLDEHFHLETRGAVEIKGKDPMETFLPARQVLTRPPSTGSVRRRDRARSDVRVGGRIPGSRNTS